MRIAYADPPYIGYARYYRDDPRAVEVDHAALVAQLDAEYDGWALSCYSNSLRLILPHCPESARVAAWVKPWCSWKRGVSPKYGWEPVIFKPARKRQPKGLYPVDWVSCNATSRRGLNGAKPEQFCFWVFNLLHAQPRDEFVDLYPGTGAVGQAWEQWSRQLRMAVAGCERSAERQPVLWTA